MAQKKRQTQQPRKKQVRQFNKHGIPIWGERKPRTKVFPGEGD